MPRFRGILNALESYSRPSYCPHPAEVAGSKPASSIPKERRFTGKTARDTVGFHVLTDLLCSNVRRSCHFNPATATSGVPSSRRCSPRDAHPGMLTQGCSPRLSRPSRFTYNLATPPFRYPDLRVGRARLGDASLINANTPTYRTYRLMISALPAAST